MAKIKKQKNVQQSLEKKKQKVLKSNGKIEGHKKARVQKKADVKVDPLDLIDELLKTETKKSSTDKLQGFKVMKWKLNKDSDVVHHLFYKKHEVSVTELSTEKPPGRTILCHNVPPYFNDRHLRDIFASFGTIAKIYIHQKPTASVPEKGDYLFPKEKDITRGFKVAYVVYTEAKAVQELVDMDPDDVEPIVLKTSPFAGIPLWINQYNKRIVPTSTLEASVKKFMEDFDRKEIQRKEMQKMANEPDDDGWITVTRTGKRSSSGLVRSEAMEERLREKKRKQEKHIHNFTPAQIKESKMKQLLELKKKFEEDKQRVALLKQQRKFKPF